MSLEFPLWIGPKAGDAVGPPFGAQQYRQIVDLLFDEGVINVGAGQLLVTPSSGMTLAVAPGAYVIDGDDVTGQGSFYGRNLAPGDTVTVPAAPGSNSRIDRIVLRVYDAESTGGTLNLARFDVVVGTASATPVAPDVPKSAIPLARVTVAAGTSTITSAMLTDDRTQAGAATLKVGTQVTAVTQTQRDAIVAPFDGQIIHNTTIGALESGDAATATFASTRGLGLFFGNGSDGDVTITGTVTLVRDMQYRNLTVVAGGVLNTNGFRVLATGTVRNAGSINCDGGAGGVGFYSATFPTAGFTYSANAGGDPGRGGGILATNRRLGYGGDGARGSFQYYDPSNGTSAYNASAAQGSGTTTYGGKGGDGGQQQSGVAGGSASRSTGGTATALPAAPISPVLLDALSIFGPYGLAIVSGVFAVVLGGAGGGGGGWGGSRGSNFTARSGGGGGGGGIVVIVAETIINTGTISANGGRGGDAGASESGPGGGGGGGAVCLYARRLRDTGTTSANGGAVGSGSSAAATPVSAGSPGSVFKIGV